MEVRTSDDFFQVVANNELLSKERLAAARQATKDLVDAATVARTLVDRGLLTHWTASQILAGKRPLKIGKYRLLDLIDSTPWGAVYRAEHSQLKREAVIKTLARRNAVTKNIVSDFVREARRLSILDHPNLIHLYDIDQEEHFFYLAMEYCEGTDLARKVSQEGPLAAWQAADFISQAAKGLAHAHEKNIFHYAIMPSRLVANDRGNLKLLDTGVAKLEALKETSVADTTSTMASLEYMAPEQLTQRDTIDQRADVYSLGCTLFFLLTGTPPFEKDEALAQIESRMEGKPPDVRELQSDVPGELAVICSKMMASRPEDRYQTAAEVASALDAWLASAVARPAPSAAVPEQATEAARPVREAVLVGAWEEPAHDRDDTAGTSDEVAQPPVTENPWFANRWLIIGGAIAALFLCVTIVFVLSRSKDGEPPESSSSQQAGRQSQDQRGTAGRQTKRSNDDPDFDFPEPGAYVKSGEEAVKQQPPISKKKPIAKVAPPAVARPQGDPSLAYWRFEGGVPNAYVKNLTKIGFPAAVADSSPNGNSLYCLRPSVAPKHALDVPATELRFAKTVQKNAGSLDDTQPAAVGETARFLISDSERANAKLDAESYSLESWTVEASFRLANIEGVQTLICKNGRPTAAPEPPFKLQFDGNRKQLAVAVIDRSGKLRTVATAPDFVIAVGQWIHVAVVGNGKELQMFGCPPGATQYRLLGKTDISGGLIASSGAWTVGAALDGQAATEDALAMVDEIRISRVALPPQDFLFAQDVPAEKPKTGISKQEPPATSKKPTVAAKGRKTDAAKGRQRAATPFVDISPQTLPALPTKGTPAPDFADVRPLGAVYFANVEDFQPSLVGGDGGHGAQGTFDLRPSAGGADAKQWDFRFTSAAGGTVTPIARLRLADYDLSLYWLDAAAEIAGADHLRNCWLDLRVGEKSKRFALRSAADSQPIGFSFARRRRKGNAVTVVSPPSEDRLRVEIRLPEAVFGPSTLDPAGPLAIDDGKAEAKLGEQKIMTMRLATTWKSPELELNARLYYQPDPESEKLKIFTAKNVTGELATVLRKLETVKRDLAALEKKKMYDNAKQKKPEEKREHDALRRRFPKLEGPKLDAAIKRGRTFVEKLAEVADRYTKLADLGQTLQLPASESGALIELRVFMTSDGSQVDLVRTTGWSEQ